MPNAPHTPVLLAEVLTALAPQSKGKYVDATFGNGGYSRAILGLADVELLAFDRDKNVLLRVQEFEKQFPNRFIFVRDEFANLSFHLQEKNFLPLDGIVFDIGVSSMQVDQAERGFSFKVDGPLDMRMNQDSPITAEYMVNNYSEKELADIIFHYGDERKSFRIARDIVRKREEEPIKTTLQLANIIRKSVGKYNDTIDPATRTFQALRIAVNDELNQLENALREASELLVINGKMIVVSFHSGEDRIVKQFFNKLLGKSEGYVPNFLPTHLKNSSLKEFKLLHKGVITATNEEVERNPRSRSAKMRAIVRVK